jgi:hypothetical protein
LAARSWEASSQRAQRCSSRWSRNGLQPAEWAKRAGLRNANSIYNFLRGESASLNYATYEKLARVIPGTTIARLTGEASVSPTSSVPSITVDTNAAANRLTKKAELPAADQYQMGVTTKHSVLPGAHGLEILDDSADEIYPAGTILICVPFRNFTSGLKIGHRVILRCRHKDGSFEITVRQVRRDENDQFWLWMRSTNPRLQDAVAIPRRYNGGRFKLGDGTTGEITDVIIASYRSEI